MAPTTAPTLLRPSRAVLGGRRGIATRVLLDMNDALAPITEGVALCDDVLARVARITNAAMAGSRMAVVNEANRLGHRAQGYRERFRRMAGEIEGPDDGEAA